ncbi:MAG: SDR family NAD(P)-dependent oxidoreductase [Chloroflexota bacterium]
MTQQKLALITGGSKGLGKTLAGWLVHQGYDLILTARTADTLTATASELETADASIHALVGDVSDEAHQQAIADVVANYGQLDLLFNNASTLGTLPMPSLTDYDLDALAHVFRVNVIAPITLTQKLLPYLSDGLVVNLSSDAALGGYAGWGAYGASKAALDLISKTLANELHAQNVAVISVDPGDMRTDMHQDAFPNDDISDRPLPDVTLPFWGWLLGQDHMAISGQRFSAQAEVWEVTS